MHEIDFRSDTKTLPSPDMRRAMAEAELGDDVSGEDPTVNRLEAMSAEMLGKEAAVLVASGTMGNLIGVLAQCQRGEEVILGDKSHIYRAEAGGVSVLGGVVMQMLPNDGAGRLDLDEIESAIHPADSHYPPTKLIALENTANASGGAPLTPEYMGEVGRLAREHGIKVHVDGARLFNAAVCLETPAAELAADADTVTFCLSKGLACPVGSVLCGDSETMERARRLRKMLGAGMRQAGIIAAPGIVALESMIDRLAEDHSNARKLALGLSEIPGIEIDPDSLPTNLLFFEITSGDPMEIGRRLRERGVLVSPERDVWRWVTHYGITSEDVDYALGVMREVMRDHAAA